MRLPTFSRHSLQRILAISLTLLISACGGPKSTFSTQPDSSNEWTWVDGSDTWNATAVYGQKGTASLGNIPGARGATADWTDRTGNFWLFGGTLAMSGVGEASVGNDLWKYDVTAQEWTWVGGSRVANQPGTYGMLDTASSSNIPGGREASTSWTDSSGNFWLFGGIAYDSIGGYAADINDLWKFTPTNGTWTWVSGSNLNSLTGVAKGVYGTQGVSSSTNVPGARDSAAGWADNSGNLWLFGGYGYDSSGEFGALNDLWEFKPSASTWTWISGSKTVFASGVYGTRGVPAASNVPQARERIVSWIDKAGNLWLFGGIGWSSSTAGMLNDLWKFDPATNIWTWISGSSTFDATSVYGTQGVPASSNIPGGRESAISWSDNAGNLWLYGGLMYGGSEFSDLWEYSPANNTWTWLSGSMVPDVAGAYGTQGIPGASNFPGSRDAAAGWTDHAGDLWLFGGGQEDSQGGGTLNDLWRYQP
ncbi:MAG: kelch repeat-containing protein [Terriglobales bacterium]